jgi:ABC-type multidrug transport system permease subunit
MIDFMEKSMGKQLNKIIAPVIVSICLIFFYCLYGIGIIIIDVPNIFKIIILILSIIITIVTIMVLIERIKEIKGGEEDDLSKY